MFTKHLRPRQRVRHVDSPDLVVLDGAGDVTWLSDSRGLVCLLGCGERIPMGERDLMAEAMHLHREGCRP